MTSLLNENEWHPWAILGWPPLCTYEYPGYEAAYEINELTGVIYNTDTYVYVTARQSV